MQQKIPDLTPSPWGQIIGSTLFGLTLQQTNLSTDSFQSNTHFLIMNHSNETNLKIICSIRQNQYQNHSFPSLGQVRPTQWGPSTAARQARGLRGKGPNRPVATFFCSDAVVIFNRILLVGRTVERSVQRVFVHCHASESSRKNLTLDNFVFYTIIQNKNLNIFQSLFDHNYLYLYVQPSLQKNI